MIKPGDHKLSFVFQYKKDINENNFFKVTGETKISIKAGKNIFSFHAKKKRMENSLLTVIF